MPFHTTIARRVWSTAPRSGWEWEIRDASGRVRKQGWTRGSRMDAAREAAADVRGLMQSGEEVAHV